MLDITVPQHGVMSHPQQGDISLGSSVLGAEIGLGVTEYRKSLKVLTSPLYFEGSSACGTLSYFEEEEEEPPGEAALSPGTLIFTQTNRSLHLGDLWFQPSPSSPRLLLQGRGMLPPRADTAPHAACPGVHVAHWGSDGTSGMGKGPCLQHPALMETSLPLRHGNTTQIMTHDALSPPSHL